MNTTRRKTEASEMAVERHTMPCRYTRMFYSLPNNDKVRRFPALHVRVSAISDRLKRLHMTTQPKDQKFFDQLTDWCFTPLSKLFQSIHGDCSHIHVFLSFTDIRLRL